MVRSVSNDAVVVCIARLRLTSSRAPCRLHFLFFGIVDGIESESIKYVHLNLNLALKDRGADIRDGRICTALFGRIIRISYTLYTP